MDRDFFDAVKDFDLERYFDETREPDVRLRTHALYERTKKTVAREREISLEVTLLIGLLEVKNAAVNLGLGKREYLAASLGMTPTQYWKRAQAGRVLVGFPAFIDLVKRGLTHISHVAILAPKITRANAVLFADEVPGKSERQVRELVASINKDGSRMEVEPLFEMKLKLTKSQWDTLDRAREVLSATGRVPSDEEVILRAAEDLLDKRDPLRKAQRAARRAAQRASVNRAEPGAEENPDPTAVPKSAGDHESPASLPKPAAGSGNPTSVPKGTGDHQITTLVSKSGAACEEVASVPKCPGETFSFEPEPENSTADNPADVIQPRAGGFAGDHDIPTSAPKCGGDTPAAASAPQRADFAGGPTSVPKSADRVRNAEPPATGVADFDIQRGEKPARDANGARPKGRKGIPAATLHQVWLRDGGACTYVGADGERCGSKVGVQVDHIRCVAFGQDNRVENLRLLCVEHNRAEAQRLLGERVMERYRWLTSRGGGAASGNS